LPDELFTINTTKPIDIKIQSIVENTREKLAQNPEDTEALIDLARAKYDLADFEGAVVVYKLALETRPTDTLILNNLGDTYGILKQYENSAEMYLKIIEVNPRWVNSYRELKTIYKFHLTEKYPEIENVLLKGIEKIQEIDSFGAIDLYTMLANYYQDTENNEKAIEWYEKALQINPENEAVARELEELKSE
jgi:tetratricopeptide (TPR) repeat protein